MESEDNYKKDFDNWIIVKKKTEKRSRINAYKYSVFWCAFGENVGSEISGKGNNFLRPVVVLKKFGDRCVLVAPLTSNLNENKNNILIKIEGEDFFKNVLVSQMRVVDSKRLYDYMGKIKEEFRQMIKDSFNKVVKI